MLAFHHFLDLMMHYYTTSCPAGPNITCKKLAAISSVRSEITCTLWGKEWKQAADECVVAVTKGAYFLKYKLCEKNTDAFKASLPQQALAHSRLVGLVPVDGCRGSSGCLQFQRSRDGCEDNSEKTKAAGQVYLFSIFQKQGQQTVFLRHSRLDERKKADKI